MILDPRYFSLNDLLRRPLHQPHWGAGALTLALETDSEPLLPAEGHWRPSHSSLYGRAELSGLQVAQESFVTTGGTEVVQILVRNPSAETVFVELMPQWHPHYPTLFLGLEKRLKCGCR